MRQVINLETGNITWAEDAAPGIILPATAEQNKAQASQLLLESDWVNQPDVVDVTVNPHLLNKADFDSYRQALRVIAVYPVSGDLTWPVKPQSQWSTV